MQLLMILMLVLILVCAVCVALTRNLLTAALVFMAQSLAMSVVWILLESPDLAITEAAVGTGIDSLLLFAALKKIHAVDTAAEAEREAREREAQKKPAAETAAPAEAPGTEAPEAETAQPQAPETAVPETEAVEPDTPETEPEGGQAHGEEA